MKPPSFSLVHTPSIAAALASPRAAANELAAPAADALTTPFNSGAAPAPAEGYKAVSDLIEEQNPSVAKGLSELPGPLARSLVASALRPGSVEDRMTVAEVLEPAVVDLSRNKDVVTVALWDVDARVGNLTHIVSRLNQAQPAYTFFTLQAAVPAGLVIDAEHSEAFARARGKRWTSEQREAIKQDLKSNLMSNDFFKHARAVQRDVGVQYLVGITRFRIAGEEGGGLFWNYIAVSSGKLMLVSVNDLRSFAREAGRPFEVAVAALVVAQVLSATNKRLSFHDDTGCLFDFNESRISLVQTLQNLRIEPRCQSKIDPKYREAADAMIDVLRSYERSDPAEPPPVKAKSKQDDSYWLKQLAGLAKSSKKGTAL